MSDALVSSLEARIKFLEGERDKYHRAFTAKNAELKTVKAERDEFADAIETLSDERDSLKKTGASPDDKDTRIKDLEAQIATRDHKDTFAQAAKKAGVNPERLDDLYGLSGLKPGDQPSKPEDFADYLATAKESRPWAFGEASPPAGQGGNSQAPLSLGNAPAAPMGGRGAPGTPAARLQYSRADVRKPGWQKDRPELVEALKTGRADLIGE